MKHIVCYLGAVLLLSCNASNTHSSMTNEQAPVIIYKTSADYDHYVPVTLNEGKDTITAFPHPKDIFYEGELALPVKLKDGYLLDRRGLNAHSAFTSYTYEEYSELKSPPPPEELYKRIIDKDPFDVMYECSGIVDIDHISKEIDRLVKSDFQGCTILK